MGRRPKTYSQSTRIERMMRGLAARGWTISELAQEFEVSRRQVIRDLARIGEGHPLEGDGQGGEKVYSLPLGYKGLPPISITKFELMSLCLAKSHVEYLKGTPFLDDLESVIQKVRVSLPDKVANHLQKILQIAVPLHRPNRHYGAHRQVIDSLRMALLLQRRVVLTYRKPDAAKPATYRFDPARLLLYKDGLYVQGWSHASDEVRTFLVERIQKVEVTDEPFEMPAALASATQLDQAFGVFAGPPENVKIQFKKDVAYLLHERQWHPSQKVTRMKNGAVLLQMRVGGMEELCSWVLAWGPQAKVLAPPRLVKMVAGELHAAARQYPRC